MAVGYTPRAITPLTPGATTNSFVPPNIMGNQAALQNTAAARNAAAAAKITGGAPVGSAAPAATGPFTMPGANQATAAQMAGMTPQQLHDYGMASLAAGGHSVAWQQAQGNAPPVIPPASTGWQPAPTSGGSSGTGGLGVTPINESGAKIQNPNTGINPVSVSIDPNIMNSMQNYSDAAYQSATRELDPQWAQNQNQIQQQLIGQGLQPGSQAYNAAMQTFNQSKNDAYAQARNQGLTQGLAAQNQAFGQGLSQTTLANELLKQQMQGGAQIASANASAGGQVGAANIGANASMSNNSQNNATQQLMALLNGGLQQQQNNTSLLGTLGNLGLGYNGQQQTANQNDFQNWMAMNNFGQGQQVYNNSIPGQESQNAQSWMQFMPRGGPAPVDVTGAYGLNQAGQNAAYGANASQANAQNQEMGSLMEAGMMMMMMCSKDFKDEIETVDPETTLQAVLKMPLSKWKYKGQQTEHIGTYAEDFNKQLGLQPTPVIQLIDMMGALLGSIQALSARIEKLEASHA